MSNAEQNGNSPAHPCQPRGAQGEFTGEMEWGMTKREQFAMAAMQGLLSDGKPNNIRCGVPQDEYSLLAAAAVLQADALLAALEANNE